MAATISTEREDRMSQTAPTQSPATTAGDFVTFGAVHLDITDADRSLAFWRDRVGLQLRGEDDGSLHLGTGRRHPHRAQPLGRL